MRLALWTSAGVMGNVTRFIMAHVKKVSSSSNSASELNDFYYKYVEKNNMHTV